MRPTFDQRDAEIVRDRAAMLDSHDPVVGDFVRFPNEIERRVSYVWKEAEGFPTAVQTSDRWGSFYLGHGYVSFSGGLYPTVPRTSLTDTGERKEGHIWIFHHDHAMADNAVLAQIPFRVWTCSQEAPR